MAQEWKTADGDMRRFILGEEKKRCRKACLVRTIMAAFFVLMSFVIFSVAQVQVKKSVEQISYPNGNSSGVMQYIDSSSELNEKKAETAEETVRILGIVNAVIIAGIIILTGSLCAVDIKRYRKFKSNEIEYNNAAVTGKKIYRRARRSFF